MTIDDLVKILLGLSLAVSLVGISIQVMRLLGVFTNILEDSRYLLRTVYDLLEKVNRDYERVTKQIESIISPIIDFSEHFLKPVAKFGRIAGKYAESFSEKISKR